MDIAPQLNQDPHPFPSYKEALEEIGRQINNRKGSFVRRIALFIWPLWIVVILGYVMIWFFGIEKGAQGMDVETLQSVWFSYLFYALMVWLAFTLLWAIRFGFANIFNGLER